MPGPGGGSSGGGFGGGSFGGGGGFSGGGGFGGGSFGGGNHGGSFGGGPHHRPHHHGPHFHGPFFGGGWGWGRRRYRGGCGSGIIILIIFVVFALSAFNSEPSVNYEFYDEEPVSAVPEGSVIYDEAVMQDYANDNYKKRFGDYDNYENNILLVFLTNEACDGYYTIAWVGDNIRPEINEMFGEYTEYGQALSNHINQNYYAYSLDTDLTAVVKEMTDSITSLGLDSSFNSDTEEYEMPVSKLYNATALEMNTDIIDAALADFTEKTGIPCVIAVDSSEKVFGGKESFVTDDEAVSAPPATVVGGIPHDEDSENFEVIDGADDIAQIKLNDGFSIVFVIVAVLIAIVGVGLVIRLKRGNKFSEEIKEEKRKDLSGGKDEKPPWEL
ncbi:MAG: hypothetical protein IJB74_05480 [Clostridia bacterium]|nr:hypothetical protein [Clostridia bacterium]